MKEHGLQVEGDKVGGGVLIACYSKGEKNIQLRNFE